MAVDWIKGFFIPIIELVIVGGVVGFILFISIRAWLKIWRTNLKWFVKYQIPFIKQKYDPANVKWVLDAFESNIDYWGAKKFLMLKGVPMDRVNETMWIYDKISRELKGGLDGQRTTRSFGKNTAIKTTSLPTTSKAE